jgi:hypothetical protein
MFHGDDPSLVHTMDRAVRAADEVGHPRVGSEHLLLALTLEDGPLADLFRCHGITAPALRDIVHTAPLGAGAASDRQLLRVLGVDLDVLLGAAGPAPLDHPARRQPVFPLGAHRARARCAQKQPPIGLDAQAAYSASLRLALARREPTHRPEHLALTLVALDPGINWVLQTAGTDREALLADLRCAFPPPRRHMLWRIERRLGRALRCNNLIRRYQDLTGRDVIDRTALPQLVSV